MMNITKLFVLSMAIISVMAFNTVSYAGYKDSLLEGYSISVKPSSNGTIKKESIAKGSPIVISEENIKTLDSYKGKSSDEIMQIQLNSSNWYTRNRARQIYARIHPAEQKEYILLADKEDFPGATLALVKEAIDAKDSNKAKELLKRTCDNTITFASRYDDQVLLEHVKGIKMIVKTNPELATAFEDFKDDALFKEKEKETIVLKEKSLEEVQQLKQFFEKPVENGKTSVSYEDEFEFSDTEEDFDLFSRLSKPISAANEEKGEDEDIDWDAFTSDLD